MHIEWKAGKGGGTIELVCNVGDKRYRLAYNQSPIASVSEWKLFEWRRRFWMAIKSTRNAAITCIAEAQAWAEALIAEDQRKHAIKSAAAYETLKRKQYRERKERLAE